MGAANLIPSASDDWSILDHKFARDCHCSESMKISSHCFLSRKSWSLSVLGNGRQSKVGEVLTLNVECVPYYILVDEPALADVQVAVCRIMQDDARTASQSVLMTVVFPVPAFPLFHSMSKGECSLALDCIQARKEAVTSQVWERKSIGKAKQRHDTQEKMECHVRGRCQIRANTSRHNISPLKLHLLLDSEFVRAWRDERHFRYCFYLVVYLVYRSI